MRLSALEALRNALYKFKTYLLTYLLHICNTITIMEIGRLLEIESANEFDDHLCLNSISLVIGPYATVPFCEVRDAARD